MTRRCFSYLVTGLLLLAATGQGWAQNLSYVGDLASTRAFMADLAQLYQLQGEGEISVDLTTASEALRLAAAGEVDMGGTARSADETNAQERRATMYPIVWDALVVVVNRQNPIVNISIAQLQDVYEGKITNWNQMGGDDQAINVIAHDDPGHGVDTNLAALLLGRPNAELAATSRVGNLEQLGDAVAADPLALGVATYSSARKMPVKILTLEGRSAAYQTIQSGEYLLFTPLYLAIRDSGPNRRYVRNFLKFAGGSDAKRILRRNGVVPYADGLALVSRQLDREQLLEQLRGD